VALKTYFVEDIEYATQSAQIASEGQEEILALINDPRILVLLMAYKMGFQNAKDAFRASFGIGNSVQKASGMSELVALLNQFESIEAESAL
jgi:hypothetical protein